MGFVANGRINCRKWARATRVSRGFRLGFGTTESESMQGVDVNYNGKHGLKLRRFVELVSCSAA